VREILCSYSIEWVVNAFSLYLLSFFYTHDPLLLLYP
jgi:hypothetical protein